MASSNPHEESIEFSTSDGLRLEGELQVPEAEPWAAAVLAHPHPLHGGNMRSLVPGILFDALPESGIIAMRFNFRGVGASEGTHGAGIAERSDLLAAVDVLHDLAAGLPLVVIGSSFGADTCLCVTDSRLSGWCAVSPPLREVKLADMTAAHDARPKLLMIPEHDEFITVESAREVTSSWNNTRVEVISGADHYLVGRTSAVTELCLDFINMLRSP